MPSTISHRSAQRRAHMRRNPFSAPSFVAVVPPSAAAAMSASPRAIVPPFVPPAVPASVPSFSATMMPASSAMSVPCCLFTFSSSMRLPLIQGDPVQIYVSEVQDILQEILDDPEYCEHDDAVVGDSSK
ncbi:uncharacterized protein BYT42DRAFT_546261 [Radiomyces spectabilis]|uniref:uncharacterized protein n=1 Tax=Radiomyces spectabilis TaxID=64574 RepID=UPI00221F7952|nr:uncharacterized protein BYT42DRAFT_546261 [Radiomyces spectabilis]KAI8377592.1 hypothetical protein BYT42DRAFT_546261 [Radiomyces spectabilis]